jgi:hypothetical protein
MTTPWYQNQLRIAALQCNFEDGQAKTLQVIDKWLIAGFNTEQLFHPMAESYSAIFDPALHSDILKSYLAEARKKNLRIILYQNVHIMSGSQNDKAPLWAVRNAEDEYTKLYGTYYSGCVNSPWRDYFFQVLRDLKSFDFDGLFLDGPVVMPSYCPACKSQFKASTGAELTPQCNSRDFWFKSRSRFVQETYSIFKQLKPDAACYWNFPAQDPGPSYASLDTELPCNDILGTEGGFMFYGPAKDFPLWHPSISAKLLESLAPTKPRVIFMAANHTPWSWLMHTPVESQLCIASASAHGANLWYGICGTMTLMDHPGGKASADMMHFLAQNQAHYTNTSSASRVAVLFSYATQDAYKTTVKDSDLYGKTAASSSAAQGNASESFNGACDILGRSSIPFDILTDYALTLEKLTKYDCLILPTSACLSDETCSLIRQFVKQGGNLIATFDSSLYSAHGAQRANFALADVFGADFAGSTTSYNNFNAFAALNHPAAASLDLFLNNSDHWLPAPEFGVNITPHPGAQVLAKFHEPQLGRYTNPTPLNQPAIILNQLGKGRSLFLPGTFLEMSNKYGHDEHRRICANAARHFSTPPVELTGGLGNIEVALRKLGSSLIVHLINYAGIAPRPYTKVAPQDGLKLNLPPNSPYRTARTLVSPQTLTVSNSTIALPTLNTFQVIVLEA